MKECEHAEAGMCGLCARSLRAQLARQAAESSELLRASCVPLIARAEKAEAENADLKAKLAGEKIAYEAGFDMGLGKINDNDQRCQILIQQRDEARRQLAKANERHAKSDRCREDNWNEVLRLRVELSTQTEALNGIGISLDSWENDYLSDEGFRVRLRQILATPEPAKPGEPVCGECFKPEREHPRYEYPCRKPAKIAEPCAQCHDRKFIDEDDGLTVECLKCAPPTPPEKKEMP